ncbi:protein TORNADO 1 isoform X1 [Selaginella moellendorffii]|uniref:protein TORNADO 1 isoform X1 n=1 Tax=Selaginella moellendorffii TaxID=88036 RepID=UPI000D1CC79A|nr:protein TORNADO 1 isoform X1 [Selaginella moellendorffii]|eukprot:XP_024525065.1 protein TORNADO 1 isoform X1 [Selaginella moellendorffii]
MGEPKQARIDDYEDLGSIRSEMWYHWVSHVFELNRYRAAKFDSEDFEGFRELLLQEDNILEHVILRREGYHKAEGFLEAAVSKLSSLGIYEIDFRELVIRSFDEAIAAAKHKGMPIKLKTLFVYSCAVDLDALAGSTLPKYLERLEFFHCDCSPHLEKLLQDPACKIWELSLDQNEYLTPALFQAGTSLRKLTLIDIPNDQALLSQICGAIEGLGISNEPSPAEISLLEDCINNNAKSKLWFLELTPFYLPLSIVQLLGRLLTSPYCKLESFSLGVKRESFSSCEYFSLPLKEYQDAILSNLEANYSNRIQRLRIRGEWASKLLEDRWLRVKYRNALFQKSPVLAQSALENPPVTPSTTKLFMCGHTASGKTTISTNLVRPYAALCQCVSQDHASTVGIERRTLRFGERKKLLIYDLGGQEVYHAFHHYFLRGSDKDLFMVVCKVGGPGGDLETELQYWLRFIAAHQTATPARKPTIFLVLNIFVRHDRFLVEARAAATTLLLKYKDKLDFVQGQRGDHYFEVNGLNARQVQKELKPKLAIAVGEMINEVTVIPWTCDEVIRERASSTPWYHIHKRAQTIVQQRVVDLHEMSKAWFQGEKEDQAFAAQYTFICLHDMGEVVYFGADDTYQNTHPNDKEAALIVNNAVLDMPWFLHTVLGIFIPKQDRNNTMKWGEPKWSTAKAVQELKILGETAEGNIYFLLKLLCEMGVLIPDGMRSWDIRWSEPRNLPEHLIVPALLRDEFTGWIESEQTYDCWGRRLQADDTMKGFVLLPSVGVFAVIQAKVKEMCNRWGHGSNIGAGWVSFQEDLIQVLVTIGGDYKHWTDRQWVDIMLMVPKEEKRGLKGEQFMKEIRDCVVKETNRACPFIKLEEHALNPVKVRQFGKASRQQGSCNENSKSCWALQEVKQMVAREGFDYHFTWGFGDSTSALELLMPSEVNEIIQPRKRAVEEVVKEYNQHIVPVYQSQQQQLVQVEIPKFESDDMSNLAKFCYQLHKRQMQGIQIYMEDFKVSITDIKESLQKLQKGLKDTENALIKSCSSLLESIKLECPKLPHLTMASSLLLKYSPLIGKRANISYLCEHPSGCHPVDLKKYPGVPITIPNQWFKKYSNIFVPAITMCFTLAKLGKVAMPEGGELVGTLIELGANGLKATIDSCFEGDLNNRLQPASKDDIVELFEYVKKNSPQRYGKDRILMMKKCFGLVKSPSGWVCKDHHY